MKAIGYQAGALRDVTLEAPTPGPRDLLVQVHAVSVNPVDLKVRARTDPKADLRILGWDAAGIVQAVGAEVSRFRPGDEVFYAGANNRPGCNSELHAVDERLVGRKPRTLDFAPAAAMPLTSLTAWELLFDRFGVAHGKGGEPGVLLIVGGAGGVGSMATQLARRLTSLTVLATASRPETQAWVRKLGAHHVLDHSKPLSPQVHALAPGGATHILSLTHTDEHFVDLVDALAPEGHLGLIDDPKTAPDIRMLKVKACALHWESMFTRSTFQTPQMARQGRILEEVADLVDHGVLVTTMQENLGALTAANLQQAHTRVESSRTVGKVVLAGW